MQKKIKDLFILIICFVFVYNSDGKAEIMFEESIKNIKQQNLTVSPNYGNIPLYFIANKGQVGERALFYAKASGYTLWLTKEGLVFDSTRRIQESEFRIQNKNKKQKTKDRNPLSGTCTEEAEGRGGLEPTKFARSVPRLMFIGANNNPEIVPVDITRHRVNYFVGSDKSKWRHNIPTSKAVLYKNIYENIDLKIYGIVRSATAADDLTKRGSLQKKLRKKTRLSSKNSIEMQIEYDWVVKPGGNPGHIRFAYRDVISTRIDKKGNLIIKTAAGEMVHKKPVSFQENKAQCALTHPAPSGHPSEGGEFCVGARRAVPNEESLNSGRTVETQNLASHYVPVDVKFKKTGENTYGFTVPEYDKRTPLIIDPVVQLVYSTYLGGNRRDRGCDIAVDGSGCIYVTGDTDSANFPLANSFQSNLGGTSPDIFIAKFTADGSALEYSTYLGGNHVDVGYSIAVDSTGCAYITGLTYSKNFPVKNPIRKSYGGGGSDSFVCKISTDGSELLYSTYLGGGDSDNGWGIAVDGDGHAYVTGYTGSLNFPSVNPLQEIFGGGRDVFVVKLSVDGSGFVYATYLGGSAKDGGAGIALDSANCVYIAGSTGSKDFPIKRPYQPGRRGDTDAFVSKISADGSELLYSTYLGGSGSENRYYGYDGDIAVDKNGNAYVTGWTDSTDFPVKNAARASLNADKDAFITKLSADGKSLVYSTYIGGNKDDYAYSIAVDDWGGAYITGKTYSTTFPLRNAFQDWNKGGRHYSGYDAFVTKLSASGSFLEYSTFLGSSNIDRGNGIAVDHNDCAYITGYTCFKLPPDFPTKNPFQGKFGGGYSDAFVTKMTDDFPPTVAIISPDDGAAVSGTVLIQAEADDDVRVARVDFYLDNQLVRSDKNPPYEWEWETFNFLNGNYGIKAEAFDNKDHKTTDEIIVTVQNVVLSLSAEKKNEKAWFIRKYYGKIDLSIDNPGNLVVNKYVIYKKELGGSYQTLVEVPGSELMGGSYTYIEQYLEKDKTYYYMAKAYDGSGDTIGVSEDQGTGASKVKLKSLNKGKGE